MKKLAVFLVIVLGGWFFWAKNYGSSSMWGTTKKFLMAVGSLRKSEALALAEGEARSTVERVESSAGWAPIEAYHGQAFAKESVEKLPSGDVRLVVSEILFFDPPGATTGMGGAMAASYRDTVVLSKKSGAWKIISLDRAFIKADSTRK